MQIEGLELLQIGKMGSVSADAGTDAANSGGGGSGGAVVLLSHGFSGSGNVSASGGRGGAVESSAAVLYGRDTLRGGGGGGGGRILYYNTDFISDTLRPLASSWTSFCVAAAMSARRAADASEFSVADAVKLCGGGDVAQYPSRQVVATQTVSAADVAALLRDIDACATWTCRVFRRCARCDVALVHALCLRPHCAVACVGTCSVYPQQGASLAPHDRGFSNTAALLASRQRSDGELTYTYSPLLAWSDTLANFTGQFFVNGGNGSAAGSAGQAGSVFGPPCDLGHVRFASFLFVAYRCRVSALASLCVGCDAVVMFYCALFASSLQGGPLCRPCPAGTFMNTTGRFECLPCKNKPSKSAYAPLEGGEVSPQCRYVCDRGFTGNDCLDSIQVVLKAFGGAVAREVMAAPQVYDVCCVCDAMWCRGAGTVPGDPRRRCYHNLRRRSCAAVSKDP